MKNPISVEYISRLAFFDGEQVSRQAERDIPKELEERIPATWLELLREPCAATIRALWQPAKKYLPGFINYLACNVEGAAVVEAYGTTALLLALPDWVEEGMERQPGFCWLGLPTGHAHIESFVDKVGPIPPSLESLWRVANFINTKHPSMICSLEPTTRQLTEEPELLSVSVHSNPEEPPLECLKIASVNGQMVTCMTRPIGQIHWNDWLVEKFRHSNDYFYAGKRTLDRMLSDDWEPPVGVSSSEPSELE
jgi:hypothetical protein